MGEYRIKKLYLISEESNNFKNLLGEIEAIKDDRNITVISLSVLTSIKLKNMELDIRHRICTLINC